MVWHVHENTTTAMFFCQEADVFKDKEFCIVQGNDEYPKQRLEQEIVRLGGTFVQNAGKFAVRHCRNLRLFHRLFKCQIYSNLSILITILL